MDCSMAPWNELIRQLHDSPHQIVLAVSGGGSLAVSDLLTQPGASSTVLEAVVPYSALAVDSWLGHRPDSYCSQDTARIMAATAWWRASQLSDVDEATAPKLGIACTAALATGRPRKGEHRCWIAVESTRSSTTHSLILTKGARDRAGEEQLVRSLILRAIGEAAGLEPGPLLELSPDETVIVESETPPAEIADVRNGVLDCVWSQPGGNLSREPSQPIAGLLSGAFNPLHVGHERLRSVAEKLLDGPVAFEFPVVNADKPPLDLFSIEQRRSQFRNSLLAVTATPLFVDKAHVFPGTTFVVGFDTAARVIDPRFYHASEKEMLAAMMLIREAGCRFLVAGRQAGETFEGLSQLRLPPGFADLFTEIPEADFREDVSSTEIRLRGRQDAASH